jgi:hypothetical protein
MPEPTFQIPKEIIDPIIKAHVNDAVLQALDGPNKAVSGAILAVIQTPVDNDGKPTSWNGRPWIDWVIGDCIRKATRAAIEAQLAEHGDKLKQALMREMTRKNSPLVKSLIEGMVGAMTNPDVLKYRINVTYDKKD